MMDEPETITLKIIGQDADGTLVVESIPQIPTVRIWNGEIDTRPISFAHAIWEELHPGATLAEARAV